LELQLEKWGQIGLVSLLSLEKVPSLRSHLTHERGEHGRNKSRKSLLNWLGEDAEETFSKDVQKQFLSKISSGMSFLPFFPLKVKTISGFFPFFRRLVPPVLTTRILSPSTQEAVPLLVWMGRW